MLSNGDEGVPLNETQPSAALPWFTLQEQQEALRAAQLAGRQRGQGARGYYGRGGGGGGGGRGGGGRGLL